jgi:hypothetical protein
MKEQILIDALKEIDFKLLQFEDYFHGEDGKNVTLMRVEIANALSQYQQQEYENSFESFYEAKIETQQQEISKLKTENENLRFKNSDLEQRLFSAKYAVKAGRSPKF